MINEYRNKILNFSEGNIFIFGSNSSGKTEFCESFLEIKKTSEKWIVFTKNKIQNLIKEELKILVNTKNTDKKWDLTLDSIDPPLFFKEEDLEYIEFILKIKNVKIQFSKSDGKFLLKEVVLRVHGKKFKFEEIEKMKNFLSSSEYEIVTITLFICSILNSGKNVVLDDPIEMASWENEEIFVNFISFLMQKYRKEKIILLTHRSTLFSKLISIHKKLSKESEKASFFYFIDDFIFKIKKYSTDFLEWNLLEPLIKKNFVFERIYLEEIFKKIYFKKVNENQNEKSCKKITERHSSISKEIKLHEEYKFDSKIFSNITNFIGFKYEYLNTLRNSILKDANNIVKSNEKINSLKKINIKNLKDRGAFKKNYNSNSIEFLKQNLNNFLHASSWKIWNEINLEKVFIIIEESFNLRIWKSTNSSIKIKQKIEEERNKIKSINNSVKKND